MRLYFCYAYTGRFGQSFTIQARGDGEAIEAARAHARKGFSNVSVQTFDGRVVYDEPL